MKNPEVPADSLRVALIQSPLHWCNPEENRMTFSRILQPLEDVDLMVLPEMFSTGFAIQDASAAEADGKTLEWMKEMAQQKNAALAGSVFIRDEDKLCNRFFFVCPDGQVHWADKRHLFTLSGEDRLLHPGTQQLFVSFRGWKIQCIICFDLRFPVWCRNPGDYPADLMLVPANWPDRRMDAWRILLQARAIENQLYVAGVNRTGADGNGILHSGHSMLVHPGGSILCEETQQTIVIRHTLQKEDIHNTRLNLPFLASADRFTLNL